jgi:hypothetical protein
MLRIGVDGGCPRAWAGETAGERPNDSIVIAIGRRAGSRQPRLSKARPDGRDAIGSSTTNGGLAPGCMRHDEPHWHAFAHLTLKLSGKRVR